MLDLAVILAFSNPVRQSQLTYNRPHVMLPTLGKPMVIRIMERLHRAGIRNYIVIIGENEGALAAYLNKQWLPNAQLQFVIQPTTNSLAHTLINIAQSHKKPFLITTYNTFTHANFSDTLIRRFNESNSDLLLTGASTSLSKFSTGIFAQTQDGKVICTSRKKPSPSSLTVANLAICGANFIQFLSTLSVSKYSTTKQLLDVLLLYSEAGHSTDMAETSWLLQIEADYDLLTLNQHLLHDGNNTHILSEVPPSVQITPPIRIDPNVSIGQGAKIGPCVYLESGCSIGQHSTLENTMVLENTIIPANSSFRNTILANHIRVTDPNML